jgi:acetyl esterase
VKAIVHKVKGKGEKRKCMIFFHGGGCVVGSAKSQSLVSCRYAVEADVTVISVDYRKAPEGPYPSQINDAYAAFLDI